MVAKKVSISLTAELEAVLRSLARERSQDLSPLVETLLRENWLVSTSIQKRREQQFATRSQDREGG